MAKNKKSEELEELEPIEPEPFEEDAAAAERPAADDGPQHVHNTRGVEERVGEALITSR